MIYLFKSKLDTYPQKATKNILFMTGFEKLKVFIDYRLHKLNDCLNPKR